MFSNTNANRSCERKKKKLNGVFEFETRGNIGNRGQRICGGYRDENEDEFEPPPTSILDHYHMQGFKGAKWADAGITLTKH
jgi:hypothetical protein